MQQLDLCLSLAPYPPPEISEPPNRVELLPPLHRLLLSNLGTSISAPLRSFTSPCSNKTHHLHHPPAPFTSISILPPPSYDAHHPAQPISPLPAAHLMHLHLHLPPPDGPPSSSFCRTHACSSPPDARNASPSSSTSLDACPIPGTLPFPLCNTATPLCTTLVHSFGTPLILSRLSLSPSSPLSAPFFPHFCLPPATLSSLSSLSTLFPALTILSSHLLPPSL
ncbi:hypothetical protein AAC387_Pa08g1226 [Persea americana]